MVTYRALTACRHRPLFDRVEAVQRCGVLKKPGDTGRDPSFAARLVDTLGEHIRAIKQLLGSIFHAALPDGI
ncbi:hypothetical protein GCM10023196_079510 [Actinoallomurus vinaceus]|uniref:Transposase n=1 Tax=Actinoallomurus vinaceus TaxID=1080074 RepID=A0ABP8UMB5_9ACTN